MASREGCASLSSILLCLPVLQAQQPSIAEPLPAFGHMSSPPQMGGAPMSASAAPPSLALALVPAAQPDAGTAGKSKNPFAAFDEPSDAPTALPGMVRQKM